MTRRFVSVGHVARDEFPGEPWRLGGTALYGAATAARLGREVTLVTRAGEAEKEALAARCASLGIALVRLPSLVTTTFAFRYVDGHRHLRLVARARGIAARDVPPGTLEGAPILLGSIIGEHADDLFAATDGRAALTAQGELRIFDARGDVGAGPWRRATLVLPRLRALVLSEEDLAGDLAPAEAWAREATVVVTRGERGALLLRGAERLALPAYRPAAVVDPTGAGDAFAAGLLVALDEGARIEDAVDFANCVASFCLEGVSTDGLATRERVDARRRAGERLPL